MLPIVYSAGYWIDYAALGPHVFPVEKYRLTYARLAAEGVLTAANMVAPEPIADEDVLRVHTPHYIALLREKALAGGGFLTIDTPVTQEILDAVWLATGGTLRASQLALEHGIGVNLCGGFHHAFPEHGEGFCYLNDVAIAIRRLQADGCIARSAVIDCDLHQGNGTAAIFAGDDSVFTFSIHEWNNYPIPKMISDLDINLPAGVEDAEYLRHLEEHVPSILEAHRPDLVVYLAGADPFRADKLGNLSLTIEGLRQRDEFVLRQARTRSIPVVITLAGGYAQQTEDVVTIHCNTVKAAMGSNP